MFDEPEGRERTLRERALTIAASLLVTALLGLLAFGLGSWGFGFRRYSIHQGRLERMQKLRPVMEQVVAGLAAEGSLLVASADGPAELRRLAERLAPGRAAEVVDKGRRHGRTRVFAAADMLYFIYFDREGVMRDFTCVGR